MQSRDRTVKKDLEVDVLVGLLGLWGEARCGGVLYGVMCRAIPGKSRDNCV